MAHPSACVASKSSQKVKLDVKPAGRLIRQNGEPDIRARCAERIASHQKAYMDTPKRILIVEDDIPIAEVLSLHLRDERYEVAHAADGAQGLRLLEQGAWDALILDLMLPRRRRSGNMPACSRDDALYADHHDQCAFERSASHPGP